MATRAKAQKPEIPEPYLGKSHAAGYDMDSQCIEDSLTGCNVRVSRDINKRRVCRLFLGNECYSSQRSCNINVGD